MSLALADDLVVPSQAEALKRMQDLLGGAGHAAGPVQVLDAHEPATAGRACVEPARHRGDERAEVQRPCGRWGEPTDVHEGAESTLPTFCGRTDVATVELTQENFEETVN